MIFERGQKVINVGNRVMTVCTQILYAPVLKLNSHNPITYVIVNVAISQQTRSVPECKDEYLGHRPILQTSLRQ